MSHSLQEEQRREELKALLNRGDSHSEASVNPQIKTVYWPITMNISIHDGFSSWKKIVAKSVSNADPDHSDSRAAYFPLKHRIAILHDSPSMSTKANTFSKIIIEQQSRVTYQREPITNFERDIPVTNSEGDVNQQDRTYNRVVYFPIKKNIAISRGTGRELTPAHKHSHRDSSPDPLRKPHDVGTALNYNQQ
jgi:hypothetical protein